jgi:phosphoribosylformylglycinamidine cyclo-ligase
VLDPARAGEAVARLTARGVPAWVLGEVAAGDALPADAPTGDADVVRGAKGVRGGAVVTVGEHPPA